MKLRYKYVSDDGKFEVLGDDESMKSLGYPTGQGVVLKGITGENCEDYVFIPFAQIQEIIAMLHHAREHFQK